MYFILQDLKLDSKLEAADTGYGSFSSLRFQFLISSFQFQTAAFLQPLRGHVLCALHDGMLHPLLNPRQTLLNPIEVLSNVITKVVEAAVHVVDAAMHAIDSPIIGHNAQQNRHHVLQSTLALTTSR
jgi:hypothetical protein